MFTKCVHLVMKCVDLLHPFIFSSFHGNLDTLMDISPLKFKTGHRLKKDYVHVVCTSFIPKHRQQRDVVFLLRHSPLYGRREILIAHDNFYSFMGENIQICQVN